MAVRLITLNCPSALAAEYWDDYKKQFLDIVANSFLEEYDELNIEVAFKNAVANSVYIHR